MDVQEVIAEILERHPDWQIEHTECHSVEKCGRRIWWKVVVTSRTGLRFSGGVHGIDNMRESIVPHAKECELRRAESELERAEAQHRVTA